MAKYRYSWRGIDRQGKVVTGYASSDQREDVAQQLRQQRIRATRIQRQLAWPAWLNDATKERLSARDITAFTRQLATLLHAGVPLLQALEILRRGENKKALQTTIQALHQSIEAGMALNHALRQHVAFDVFYC
ncbi:MAG: hypothetical protein RIT15_1346, partial [Pseudomonadota bacterium]